MKPNDVINLIDNAKSYPDPLTISWRRHHISQFYVFDIILLRLLLCNTCYFIAGAYFVGAWGFLIGSLFYLPNNFFLTPGGWLFSVGAAGFFYADIMDWVWKIVMFKVFQYKLYILRISGRITALGALITSDIAMILSLRWALSTATQQLCLGSSIGQRPD